MTNKDTPSVRLHESFIPFLEKAQTNRVREISVDEKTIGNPRMTKLIVDYFKSNNNRYLELLNMEEQNGI